MKLIRFGICGWTGLLRVRHASHHLRWGGGLKAPGGGTAASQTVARLFRKARIEKGGTPGKRSVPHLSSCVAECGKHNQRKSGGLEAPQSSLEASKSRLETLKSRPGGSKIDAWRLQNKDRNLPTHNFLRTSNIKRFKSRLPHCRRNHFEPTWLQLGGPRGPKIKAKSLKNRC